MTGQLLISHQTLILLSLTHATAFAAGIIAAWAWWCVTDAGDQMDDDSAPPDHGYRPPGHGYQPRTGNSIQAPRLPPRGGTSVRKPSDD